MTKYRPLLLLEILFNQLGLAKQIRNKLFVGFRKATKRFHIADKLFRESQMFLIAPGLSEMTQLPGDGSSFFIEFFIETPQHLREPTKFFGINNGLCHDMPADDGITERKIERPRLH